MTNPVSLVGRGEVSEPERRAGKLNGQPFLVRFAHLIVPAGLAVLMGLWGLERAGSMWRDESVSVQVSRRALGQLFGLLSNVDAVHGLYYLIAHTLFAAHQGGVIELRFLSVIAYVASTVMVATLAARLVNRRAALLSGLCYALLPINQMYSQEARSYALVSMAVVAASLLLVIFLQHPAPVRIVAYAACLAAAVWLNEVSILVVGAHAVIVVTSRVPRRARLQWVAAVIVVGLISIPILKLGQAQQISQLGWVPDIGWSGWLAIGSQVVVVSVFSMTLPQRPGHPVRPGLFAAATFCIPQLSLAWWSQLDHPVYVDRYVAFTYLGFAVAVGGLCDWTIRRVKQHVSSPLLRAVAAGAGVIALAAVSVPWSLFLRSPESRKDNVSAVQAVIRSDYTRGDGVIFVPARRREWIMTDPSLIPADADVALATSGAASNTLEGREIPAAVIPTVMSTRSTILVVGDDPMTISSAADAEKVQTLQRKYRLVGVTKVRGGAIYQYQRL